MAVLDFEVRTAWGVGMEIFASRLRGWSLGSRSQGQMVSKLGDYGLEVGGKGLGFRV